MRATTLFFAHLASLGALALPASTNLICTSGTPPPSLPPSQEACPTGPFPNYSIKCDNAISGVQIGSVRTICAEECTWACNAESTCIGVLVTNDGRCALASSVSGCFSVSGYHYIAKTNSNATPSTAAYASQPASVAAYSVAALPSSQASNPSPVPFPSQVASSSQALVSFAASIFSSAIRSSPASSSSVLPIATLAASSSTSPASSLIVSSVPAISSSQVASSSIVASSPSVSILPQVVSSSVIPVSSPAVSSSLAQSSSKVASSSSAPVSSSVRSSSSIPISSSVLSSSSIQPSSSVHVSSSSTRSTSAASTPLRPSSSLVPSSTPIASSLRSSSPAPTSTPIPASSALPSSTPSPTPSPSPASPALCGVTGYPSGTYPVVTYKNGGDLNACKQLCLDTTGCSFMIFLNDASQPTQCQVRSNALDRKGTLLPYSYSQVWEKECFVQRAVIPSVSPPPSATPSPSSSSRPVSSSAAVASTSPIPSPSVMPSTAQAALCGATGYPSDRPPIATTQTGLTLDGCKKLCLTMPDCQYVTFLNAAGQTTQCRVRSAAIDRKAALLPISYSQIWERECFTQKAITNSANPSSSPSASPSALVSPSPSPSTSPSPSPSPAAPTCPTYTGLYATACWPTTDDKCRDGFTIKCNTILTGNVIYRYAAGTTDSCVYRCTLDPSCVAITRDSASTCINYSSITEVTVKTQAQVGFGRTSVIKTASLPKK